MDSDVIINGAKGMTEGDSREKENTRINETLTIADLDRRYMSREICIIKSEAIDKIGVSMENTRKELVEIKEILASSTQWMTSHQELHAAVDSTNDTAWRKLGIAAAVVATLFTGASLGVVFLTTILKYKP